MDDSYGITFDASNRSFMEAQGIEEVLKTELKDLKDNMSSTEKELNNLSSTSPVGFKYSQKIEYKDYLDDLIYNWSVIMENANRVREIGDLINKGFTDEIKSFFQNPNDFFTFLQNVAAGKQSLSLLFGNTMLSTIDYYQILQDGWTVQGYTKISDKNGEKILITAHASEQINSRLYIYDEKTGALDTVITLNYNEHVGGISYDSDNDILWIAGDDGKVHSYDYSKIKEAKETFQKSKSNDPLRINFNDRNYSNIEIPNSIDAKKIVDSSQHHQDGMDSVYYHDGKLYSCTYSGKGELLESELVITRDNSGINISDNTKIVGELNGATQGIALYEEDGKTYVITASSAAYATTQSRITKWELTDKGLNPIGYKYIDHKGLEGIEIEDDYVKGVFEQGLPFGNQNQSTEVLANISEINESSNKTVDSLLEFGGNFWDATNGGVETEYIGPQ